MKPAVLIDTTRCTGCKACVWACKEINGLPRQDQGVKLSATTWTTVETHGEFHVKRQCMHCLDPTCVSVCPVGALEKTQEGPVIYHEDRCIGCRYCMVGCPFGVPKYEWDSPLPRVQKCIMCFEKRLKQGKQPACTAVCPAEALKFGERSELLAEAKDRIRLEPGRYVDHVYGEREAGGTSTLYLTAVPAVALGLPAALDGEPYPQLTGEILAKLPAVVSVAGVFLFGVWWITSRRETLQKVKTGQISEAEAMRRKPPLGFAAPAEKPGPEEMGESYEV